MRRRQPSCAELDPAEDFVCSRLRECALLLRHCRPPGLSRTLQLGEVNLAANHPSCCGHASVTAVAWSGGSASARCATLQPPPAPEQRGCGLRCGRAPAAAVAAACLLRSPRPMQTRWAAPSSQRSSATATGTSWKRRQTWTLHDGRLPQRAEPAAAAQCGHRRWWSDSRRLRATCPLRLRGRLWAA